jgi:hypothetical protein
MNQKKILSFSYGPYYIEVIEKVHTFLVAVA